ncbi:hypothetical protein QY887_02280 [Latilactobacillus sakei]
MVEIKVSPQDSPQMMTNFIKRYQATAIEKGQSYPFVELSSRSGVEETSTALIC